ncbi:hypothetical protein DBR32_14390 [Taibaiella sp. KBW10]|uniref:hypothetical protein n=1 Tax=Taibaiella sp. KBW10 TaxID=2153357 RepID=UPI000F59D3D5|nr:hypothetical protein [Taibaiella sp. KBW10]RQO29771.1 hypothetical protein DBR32_14390 [Taibaiella sp. KBW10]
MIKSGILLLSFIFTTARHLSAGSIATPRLDGLTEHQNTEDNILLDKVLEQLKCSKSEIREELYTEKIWPYDPSLTIMVIPKIAQQELDAYGNGSYVMDSYVLLVDHKTATIKNLFYEAEAWNSDAMVLSEIVIDTAPYQLNNDTRGFGIRINYTGSSRPNPYNQTLFTLFIPEGDRLRPLLKDYEIDRFTGEWDTNCAGAFDDRASVIMIDKAQTNHFNNIILKQTLRHTLNYKVGEDCEEKVSTKKKTVLLKFDKKSYR